MWQYVHMTKTLHFQGTDTLPTEAGERKKGLQGHRYVLSSVPTKHISQLQASLTNWGVNLKQKVLHKSKMKKLRREREGRWQDQNSRTLVVTANRLRLKNTSTNERNTKLCARIRIPYFNTYTRENGLRQFLFNLSRNICWKLRNKLRKKRREGDKEEKKVWMSVWDGEGEKNKRRYKSVWAETARASWQCCKGRKEHSFERRRASAQPRVSKKGPTDNTGSRSRSTRSQRNECEDCAALYTDRITDTWPFQQPVSNYQSFFYNRQCK